MQMSGTQGFLRCLYHVARSEASDRELVAALIARRDETAFEALVERHGPMVLAVCKRMLRHAHDAEDAFQSTFLVLIRKAATIRKPEAIASWLYGAAYLVARKARTANARRSALELQAAVSANSGRARPVYTLDEELSALPEKYRLPLVLCELEGRPRQEVAGQLRIPEGTLSSRLATGRKMLAKRLRRDGWIFSGVTPAAARLPVPLTMRTVETGRSVLAGRDLAGLVSTEVVALSRGAMRAMFISRLKAPAAAMLVAAALGLGTDRLAHTVLADGSAAANTDQQNGPTDPGGRAKAKSEFDAQMQKVAGLFKHRVPVETGRSESKGGARIQILGVWGTRPEIAVGGSYLVHGKYALPSHERGMLYFHLSASDPRMAVSYDVDLQCVSVPKGEGEFTLLHSMVGPGYFHLQLSGQASGQASTVADVYFGTGETVLRSK
jgi:RNA polymerase sigma factor (sigma-70 family)